MLIKALEKEREKEREKARKEEREATENRLRKQFIIKMYNKGMAVKEISDYTDIPESEILKILDKQN